MLLSKPEICVHIETISELYDNENLLDYLAFGFDRKRGYLDGFLNELKQLESMGKIELINVLKLSFGTLYHDGYSIIVWRPKSII